VFLHTRFFFLLSLSLPSSLSIFLSPDCNGDATYVLFISSTSPSAVFVAHLTIMVGSSGDDENDSSTSTSEEVVTLTGHENGFWLQGHFNESCERVSAKHMLVGRYSFQDMLNHVCAVIKAESMDVPYLGLTTLKLFYRFHEHEGRHFPTMRCIHMLCRAPTNTLRVWEGNLIHECKQMGVNLKNTSGKGGAGVKRSAKPCTLYLAACSWEGTCTCKFCKQFVADQISSGEEVTECWFPRAVTSSSQLEASKEEQAAKEEAASEEEAPTKKKQKSSG
jgi:hypothetical protein